ncbi:unnamed protein product [Acanthoscelides obtectus]|nr:unnamed protein product [Acanthoscelides obtectus]CAK1677826.1 Leucine-rich repeat and IQ domain-containing protein 4 [Acanthoscelides obtectus]
MLLTDVQENGSYENFEEMLQMFHQMYQDEEDLIEDTKYRETRVVQLQEILEKESRILTAKISDYMQKIGSLKDGIEDFSSEASMKIRYITDLKKAEHEMADKQHSDMEQKLLIKIKTTEGDIMKEIRVHEELVTFFNLLQKELEDVLNSWKLRYTKTLSCLNKKIEVETEKVSSVVAEINRMKELYAKREIEINDYKAYKKQQEEKRLLKKKMDDAATKIQAWWRGTMVRKGFGKYRKKKDKKGKKNKNKK